MHSAGSLVANYLLQVIAADFPSLRSRVHRYIVMAPACHLTQFQAAVGAVTTEQPTVVMTLTPEAEAADRVGSPDQVLVYEKSLLWAIHDLFESGWGRAEWEGYAIPLAPGVPEEHPINRTLLGIEEQIAGLENQADLAFDRTLGGQVLWLQSTLEIPLADAPPRVWSRAVTHGAFDNDPTTAESIKVLLG